MKRIIVLLLITMLLSLMGCGVEEPTEQPDAVKKTEEAGEIRLPNPSAFLGSQPDKIEDSDERVRWTFYLDPEEKMLAVQYMELLWSGEYPLYTLRHIKNESNDEAWSRFAYLEYTGEEQIGTLDMAAYECHVYVGISMEGEKVKLITEYAPGFALVDTGERADRSVLGATEPEVTEVLLPDPEIYLDLQADQSKVDEDGTLRRIFYLAAEEKPLALQYLDLLYAGDYPLEAIEDITTDLDDYWSRLAYMKYTGKGRVGKFTMTAGDCQVYVGISMENDEVMLVTVYADGITLADTGERADHSVVVRREPRPEPEPEQESEPEYKPESKQEPESEPEPEPEAKTETKPAKAEVHIDPSSKELPDLMYYLNTIGSYPYYDDGGMQYGFTDLPLDYKEVLEEELTELFGQQRYQLELITSYERPITEKTYYMIYEYAYTGTGELTPISGGEENGNVRLAFCCYTKTDKMKILINYSKEFELTDPGEKTTLLVEAGNSGNSSIGNWNPQQAEFTKQDCFKCGGDGECTKCNGYRYVWIRGIKSDCTACTNGKCRKCGGSGKRDK